MTTPSEERTVWGAPHLARSGAKTYLTLVATSLSDLDALSMDEPTQIVEVEEAIETVLPEQIGGRRYDRRELLGKGGMGEVWRVWDTELMRSVALKVLHTPKSERTWKRFEEEARVAAQLQHPGIIPVHDVGRLEDGRLWFTMKEVKGQTLEDLIVATHKDWRLGRSSQWTFRRLLEGFLRVCETMAYAHARGVVHRDIKPSNLMFGDYGEILVLDWGLAKVLEEAALEEHDEDSMSTSLDRDLTAAGMISGTPNYMSPEQAQGRSAEAGPAADVYALGATLYDLLAERPPRVAQNVRKLIFQVATGRPEIQPPSVHETGAPRDEALDAIVLKALQVEEEDRYGDAGELAHDLALWLDGAKKRERAMELVGQARAGLKQSDALKTEGERLQHEAEQALAGVAKDADVAEKVPGWALEDASRDRLREAADTRNRAIQELRAALSHAPDLPEAHSELAAEFARRHRRLEEADRHDEARIVASDLALHDRAGEYAAYLAGTGALTLITDRPVEVYVHRYVEKERRLQPVFERSLGRTPLVEVPLEMGSYLLMLHADDGVEVRYPVWIRRQEHWDGVAPGESEPRVIRIPRMGQLGPDDCYVPAGWFWAGDDVDGGNLPLQRAWADGCVLKRHPVTVREYADWLNDLLDQGDAATAAAAAPVFPGDDRVAFLAMEGGRYTGLPQFIDVFADWQWSPDQPVSVLSHRQAMMYATHHNCRLPSEGEVQHAARGADRRNYPWGDHFDPQWAHGTGPRLAPVGANPVDTGPSGIQGHTGGVMCWVDATEPGKDLAVGGRFGNGARGSVVARRHPFHPGWGEIAIGFRLANGLEDFLDQR